NKPVILAAGTPQVLLPYDNANLFVHNLSAHKGPLATWTAWVVPRTMRPADAAREVGMTESGLRDLNHIPPKMLVKAGSTLLVPRSQNRTQDVSESLADNAMMALAPDVPPLRRMAWKAGKRDTVKSVAKRYGISPQQVAQWNKISPSASFKRGEQIVVYVPNKQADKIKDKSEATRMVARGQDKVKQVALKKDKRVVASAAGRTSTTRSASKAGNRQAPTRSARVRVASAR
ncbi:MAG TPA: LysM peptidoglycan-binding domain-containing protein, partial [Aquabacterium sp.]|nr:LysM peptidoglycan-binding domain-containing protein [Aquabacterium sp.]